MNGCSDRTAVPDTESKRDRPSMPSSARTAPHPSRPDALRRRLHPRASPRPPVGGARRARTSPLPGMVAPARCDRAGRSRRRAQRPAWAWRRRRSRPRASTSAPTRCRSATRATSGRASPGRSTTACSAGTRRKTGRVGQPFAPMYTLRADQRRRRQRQLADGRARTSSQSQGNDTRAHYCARRLRLVRPAEREPRRRTRRTTRSRRGTPSSVGSGQAGRRSPR